MSFQRNIHQKTIIVLQQHRHWNATQLSSTMTKQLSLTQFNKDDTLKDIC